LVFGVFGAAGAAADPARAVPFDTIIREDAHLLSFWEKRK
jgi:hypothetical protein